VSETKDFHIARECEIRICREPAYEQSAEGYWLCPDHKLAHEEEQKHSDCEFDEIGRKQSVMRNARAL
jgi:hypothetical protein